MSDLAGKSSNLSRAGVRIVKPHQFDSNTPQTPGMLRMAAISRELAGSEGLWGGVTVVEPNTVSAIHHHGELETIIYVVSGQGRLRWGDNMEFEQDVEPGDFIFVPPFVLHQEINPSPDTSSSWVIVRNSQEPIVVNLETPDSAQQAANDATHKF
ncbi:MAG: cupin domain-containing protein [Chroococcidiopsidaceae cyanobacterium CP_BM_ER_R8_30]|nr:cupin domain-containing protein [Chroococcidiopsidaceae cyanobacterium CP_BM_ER_R8_30]